MYLVNGNENKALRSPCLSHSTHHLSITRKYLFDPEFQKSRLLIYSSIAGHTYMFHSVEG